MLAGGFCKKLISFTILICFLFLSLTNSIVIPYPLEDLKCYGFILPNPRFDNRAFENQIYCKIRHLVNDLLRQEISVFWTSININTSIREINNETEQWMILEKGAFIIPFTGNDSQDIKIVTIITDYNQSSEIDEKNDVKIPVYLLTSQLIIKGYHLSNVKIANYINILTCGESWFANIASKCGFLDFSFIDNKDTGKDLNNSNYNLLIWPGYDGYYPEFYAYLEVLLDLSNGRNNAIRNFVSKGGGFVGSCYSVYMASRGISILKYSSRKAHNPNLRSIGFLSISDIISGDGKVILPGLEQEVSDVNHPVVYGIDKYLFGGWGSGPMIVDVGQGVDVIAKFKNDSKLGDTPSIVSNDFGNGRVVLFCPHLEINDPDTAPKFWDLGTKDTYNGKKIVCNAFYYSTAQDEAEHEIIIFRPISFFYEIFDETNDLSNFLNEQVEFFEEIEKSINQSIEDIKNINIRISSILNTIEQIAQSQQIDINETKKALYYAGTQYLLYCFDHINECLENTSSTIQTIEKLYPLLENDSNFIEMLLTLKADLSFKTNKIKKILSTCFVKIQKMEEILKLYQEQEGFKNIREKIFKKTSHDIEIQTELAFQQMPEGYFNSLKFLRNQWYNYETSFAMN